ncbi:hypothetical protein J2Y69_000917 [Microbacterium resistens]|uniref:Glycosyltransferase n=1 Tax=Microbacterium resistens TaxID=156977 RepID=A0ABU1S9Q9_9MICO|nr:hypothetical protein [Microbacterium resistens]MDR6866325.1 hypothetical protein [Microbacterium resistens]
MPPSAVESAYGVIARLLPGPVADRVLPGRRREFRETGVTRARDARRRLVIGPVNSAGQGYAWARAAERLPDVAAASFMYRGADDVFGFTADHVIPVGALISNGRWRAAQREAVLTGFTHAIVESGRPLLGREEDVLAQIRLLQERGIRVALLWHGSDIRLPSAHAAREPDSPFAHGYPDTAALERIAAANRALADAADVPVFVSTPDLLVDAPRGAEWLPLVVDADAWAVAGAKPAFARERPVVVHAPSSAGLKGTAGIAAAMGRLHEEGLIEYREVHGVPSARMPDLYGDADVVLDQFVVGSYGVATVEAMAAGRLVVGHIRDEVRETVRRRSGQELPVVQSRAGGIEEALRRIVADRAGSASLAARGPAFVRRVHDGALAAGVLQGFLDS